MAKNFVPETEYTKMKVDTFANKDTIQDTMFMAETQLFFGRTALNNLAESVKKYGNSVLMVYGGGSIKRSGLYDKVVKIFNENGISFMELPGVEPNPKMGLVRKGIEMVRENKLEVILAVGGGSCVDTAKAIGTGAKFDEDVSQLIGRWWVGDVVPILVISTMSGAGTEMTTSSVLNNEETHVKASFHGPNVRPRVTFLNPEYTFTVPKKQTAAGVADGFSHTIESYFSHWTGAYLHQTFGESLLKTLVKYGPIACNEPDNYEARANIMLACTWACNGLTFKGNYVMWTCHMLEHELSAFNDKVTHGEGLAILTPAWMRWALDESRAWRYVDMAVNVFGIDPTGKTDLEVAELGIQAVEDFLFNKMGMPRRLRDIGVDEKDFPAMVERISHKDPNSIAIQWKPLSPEDAMEIYKACY